MNRNSFYDFVFYRTDFEELCLERKREKEMEAAKLEEQSKS